MARVERVANVKAKLQALAKGPHRASVIVGYTQNYAIYVHENLQARHPVGQAKYLEQPLRENAKGIAEVIRRAYVQTKDLAKSLLLGGLFLQSKSQPLVPVDTGALKNSAFTREEK